MSGMDSKKSRSKSLRTFGSVDSLYESSSSEEDRVFSDTNNASCHKKARFVKDGHTIRLTSEAVTQKRRKKPSSKGIKLIKEEVLKLTGEAEKPQELELESGESEKEESKVEEPKLEQPEADNVKAEEVTCKVDDSGEVEAKPQAQEPESVPEKSVANAEETETKGVKVVNSNELSTSAGKVEADEVKVVETVFKVEESSAVEPKGQESELVPANALGSKEEEPEVKGPKVVTCCEPSTSANAERVQAVESRNVNDSDSSFESAADEMYNSVSNDEKDANLAGEENITLKNDLLDIAKALDERESEIKELKMFIYNMNVLKPEVLDKTFGSFRKETKNARFLEGIKRLEKYQVIAQGFVDEAVWNKKNGAEQAKAMIHLLLDNVDRIKVVWENAGAIKATMRIIIDDKNEIIDQLKEELIALKNSPEGQSKALEEALLKSEEEREEFIKNYEICLNEWNSIRCEMESQHEKMCNEIAQVHSEKSKLQRNLARAKTVFEEKCALVKKGDDTNNKLQTELLELNVILNRSRCDTQRKLNNLEEEVSYMKKHNNDSYDLLGITTADLKRFQQKTRELEKACQEKELERKDSVRAVQVEKEELERKYSKVLGDLEGITENSNKLRRINAELEDNLRSATAKNLALEAVNSSLNEEVKIVETQLKEFAQKKKENSYNKDELFQMIATLREEKSALSKEVDELKLSVQLSQHEIQAQKSDENLNVELKSLSQEILEEDKEFFKKKMAGEYKQLSSELDEFLAELAICQDERRVDFEEYKRKEKVWEKERAELMAQLNERNQVEIGLQNMITDLQSDLVEQEERFKEQSAQIFQETEEAKERIARIGQKCQELLTTKDQELENYHQINEQLHEKIPQLEEVIGAFEKRNEASVKENEELCEKIQALEKEIRDCTKREKATNKKNKELLKEVQEVHAFEKRLDEINKKNEELRVKTREIQETALEAKKREEILQKKNGKLEACKKSWKSKLDNILKTKQEAYDKLKESQKRERVLLEDLKKQDARLKICEDTKETLNAVITGLKGTLEDQTKAHDDTTTSLNREIKELEKSYEACMKLHEETKQKFNAEMTEMKDGYEACLKGHNDTEDSLNEVIKTLKDELEPRLKAHEENKRHMDDVVNSMEEDLKKVRAENVGLNEKIYFLANENKMAVEKINEMAEVIQSFQNLSIEQSEKYDEILAEEKDKQNTLQHELNNSQRALTEVSGELRKAESRYLELKLAHEKGEKLCSKLQEKLDKMHNQVESLNLELSHSKGAVEKGKIEFAELYGQYETTRKELRELKSEERANIPTEVTKFVASQNHELIIEMKKNHTTVLTAIHEQHMTDLLHDLEKMKRKTTFQRDQTMSVLRNRSL